MTGYYQSGYTVQLSSASSYTIVFTSDSFVTAEGFRMYYTTTNEGTAPYTSYTTDWYYTTYPTAIAKQ